MGDRIAVLKKGGSSPSTTRRPSCSARRPTDFVEDFVGADRALKRLALQRVRDIELWQAPIVREGEPGDGAGGGDVPYPLLVDAEDRPVAWLDGERRHKAEPLVELDDVLRDALSDLLQSEAQYAPVVDAQGKVAGVLSIELIGSELK